MKTRKNLAAVPAAQVKFLQWSRGASAGLSHPAVVVQVDLSHPGQLAWPSCQQVSALNPAEPLWGVNPSQWPRCLIEGGFNDDRGERQWGEAFVAACIALLRWAREPAWKGRVLGVSPDARQWTLALPYHRREVLMGAVELAVRRSLPESQSSPAGGLSEAVAKWLERVQPGGLAPNTHRFFIAACERGLPVTPAMGRLRLGWGCHVEWLDSSFTGRTPNLATRMARSKIMTNLVLAQAGLPVPTQCIVRSAADAREAVKVWGWPVVVKPADQDQGTAVTPYITDVQNLDAAVAGALRYSPQGAVMERHVTGDDFRMLVVGGKLRVVTRREPAGVTGDGVQSVTELVDAVNRNPWRGSGKRSLLICLNLDDDARRCLREQSIKETTVPEAERFVFLRRTANISTGGTAVDVTARVHPDNRAVAERAARILGLDIAGVDFLCPDITRSWREVGGAICEVNAQPGFRVHWLGDPTRDINGEVLDWLFRDKPARIPTAAITGTNGKTTTSSMLHAIWQAAGKTTGLCTTAGVWVGSDLVTDQNLSGYPGARMLLEDPAVEAVVVEMPRKGLLKFGHPCDRYDVAALLNVQDDHIGMDGIETLDQMAALKAQVLERATQAVVLNAEDPRVMAVVQRIPPGVRRILVARDSESPALRAHLQAGGDAVLVQTQQGQDWMVLAQGVRQTPLMPLNDIPATLGGRLRFNQVNALFATALAWAQGLDVSVIRRALGAFANTARDNPGRYNMIAGLPYQVMLDYAHNPDGVRELCAVVRQWPVDGRRLLLNLKVGSRHSAHLTAIAPDLAATFDAFVMGGNPDYVRQCPDYAAPDPMAAMLAWACQALQGAGVPPDRVMVEVDPRSALSQVLKQAQPGDLVVLLAEPCEALPALRQAGAEVGV